VLKDYQHYVTLMPLEKETPLMWTHNTVDHRLTFLYYIVVVLLWAWWGGPDGIEAWSL